MDLFFLTLKCFLNFSYLGFSLFFAVIASIVRSISDGQNVLSLGQSAGKAMADDSLKGLSVHRDMIITPIFQARKQS